MISIFDLLINVLESALFSLFIIYAIKGTIRNNFYNFVSFTLLYSFEVTIYNIYNLPDLINTILLTSLLIVQGFTLSKNIIQSCFIGITGEIISTLSVVITLLCSNYITLQYVDMVIMSKISFVILILIVGTVIKKAFDMFIYTRWLFNVVLIALTLMFNYVFELLYFTKGNRFRLYSLSITLVILTITTIIMFKRSIEEQRKTNEHKLANLELMQREKTYQQVSNSIRILGALRHDQSYLLSKIKQMTIDNRNDDIVSLIDDRLIHLEHDDKAIMTGNISLDYILDENMPVINAKNLQVKCNYYKNNLPNGHIHYYTLISNVMEFVISNCNNKMLIDRGVRDPYEYFKITFSCDHEVDKNDSDLDTIKLLCQRDNILFKVFNEYHLCKLVLLKRPNEKSS